MGTEVDVFISNYTLVDPEIYQLWIDGHSASEAVSLLNQRGLGLLTGASIELIASDVLDHFRTYSLLEKLLSNPNKLQEQLGFQIEPPTRKLLIEKYYSIDDDVVRELIGKKLTSKHRKDLDEVSDKTGVPLKSCRRQFDNVKRVFKMCEDMSGSLIANIQQLFYLNDDLARKYACIVFLAIVRFETSKKKLQHLNFNCWKRCAEAMMEQWTCNNDCYDTNEIDRDFLMELRELRGLLERDREHKQLVCSLLKPKILSKTYTDLDVNFNKYSRLIINLAINLHRHIKNMFVDLTTLVEFLKQTNLWNLEDLEKFLDVYTQTALEIDVLRESPTLMCIWDKYMIVITECILAMFI